KAHIASVFLKSRAQPGSPTPGLPDGDARFCAWWGGGTRDPYRLRPLEMKVLNSIRPQRQITHAHVRVQPILSRPISAKRAPEAALGGVETGRLQIANAHGKIGLGIVLWVHSI